MSTLYGETRPVGVDDKNFGNWEGGFWKLNGSWRRSLEGGFF